MIKITKKNFNRIHKAGELEGVRLASNNYTAEELFNHMHDTEINNLMTFKTSRVDTGNQGELSTTTIYNANIKGVDFFVVEENIDYSKDNHNSRADKMTYSILYRELSK